MAYRVRWQLVGRSGQPLDGGCVGEDFCAYRDAMAAVAEFLRPYPEVSRCPTESYWLARRSWMPISRSGSGSSVTGSRRRQEPSARGCPQVRPAPKLRPLCVTESRRALHHVLVTNPRGSSHRADAWPK